jgi:long-subunit fatty acid transport protein
VQTGVRSITKAPLVLILLLAVLPAPPGAKAQKEIAPTLEFSFSNPGARSMGFAGAFVALADDATAAFANPAGLVQIAEPEVSIEGRSWSYSTPYVAGGRIFGEPWGIGLDNTPGLRRGESSADLSGLSFLSLVYPRKRWSLAFYRHQLANFESSGAMQGLYSGPWEGVTEIRREWDLLKIADLEIVGYGFAGAYRVNEDLSFGLALTRFEGFLSSTTEAYGWNRDDVGPDEFFSPTAPIPEAFGYSASLAIDDTDWGLAAGFLWHVTRRWGLGGFFRQGPHLECTTALTAGPTNPFGVPAGTTEVVMSEPMAFPDVYGLGVSYRAFNERLTIGLEWDRVGYSEIATYLTHLFGPDGPTLEDGDEIRLGTELVFLQTRPLIAVRAGVWIDPAHQIYGGRDYVSRTILPPGEDELHLSAGLGIAFSGFQLDLGLDLSDLVDTASLSTIYSF